MLDGDRDQLVAEGKIDIQTRIVQIDDQSHEVNIIFYKK